MSNPKPLAALSLVAFCAGAAVSVGDTAMMSLPQERELPSPSLTPAKGVFLVAKRGMADPRFQRSVVLLLAHSDNGTLGLIINRPTDVPLSQVLPDLHAPNAEQHALFFGGPVGMDMLIFLTRSGVPPEHARQVMNDVYFSVDRETLEQLLTTRKARSELRLYIGHSGWGPGQLAAEIARGDWLLARADSATVFDKDLQTIWPQLIDRPSTPGRFIQYHGPEPNPVIPNSRLHAALTPLAADIALETATPHPHR
jgi:putative transcriptional regulator